MELRAYPLMGTKSRRLMVKYWRNRRTNNSFTNVYIYRPRGDLLERLANQLGMTREAVLKQIKEERRYLLKQRGYDVSRYY